MSDHAAFLRAIIAEPDDDLPRLIFADWLDERGEADRASFIRCQVELARIPDKGIARFLDVVAFDIHPTICDSLETIGGGFIPGIMRQNATAHTNEQCRSGEVVGIRGSNANYIGPFIVIQVLCQAFRQPYCKIELTANGELYERSADMWRSGLKHDALRRRARELHAANWDKWNVAPCGLTLGGANLDQWRRGFIEVVETTWADWRTHADTIRASTPLRKVRLTTPPEVTFQPPTRRDRSNEQGRTNRTSFFWFASAVGEQPQEFCLEFETSWHELSVIGPEGFDALLSHRQRQLDDARTPLGYLKVRYPGITFELPHSTLTTGTAATDIPSGMPVYRDASRRFYPAVPITPSSQPSR